MKKSLFLVATFMLSISGMKAADKLIADTTMFCSDTSYNYRLTSDATDTVMTLYIDANKYGITLENYELIPWLIEGSDWAEGGKYYKAMNGGRYIKHVVIGKHVCGLDRWIMGMGESVTFRCVEDIIFQGNVKWLSMGAYTVAGHILTEAEKDSIYKAGEDIFDGGYSVLRTVIFTNDSMRSAPKIGSENPDEYTNKMAIGDSCGWVSSPQVAVKVPITPNCELLNAFRNDSAWSISGAINDGSVFFTDKTETSAVVHFYPVQGAGHYKIYLYDPVDSAYVDSLALTAANADGTGISLAQMTAPTSQRMAIMGSMLTLSDNSGGSTSTDPVNIDMTPRKRKVIRKKEEDSEWRYQVVVQVLDRQAKPAVLSSLGGEINSVTVDTPPIIVVPTAIVSPCVTPLDHSTLYYDIFGRVATTPTHSGIWINNGKKILIR